MGTPSHAELQEACLALFGLQFERTFLGHLQETGLRAAWRRAALQWHPDRVAGADAKRRHAERFIEARQAYALLSDYLGTRDRRAAPPPARPARPAPRPAPPPPVRENHRARPHRSGVRPREARGRASAVPRRRLRFGEFLYHSGVITFGTLVESIVWQRRQRERFCEIGLRWGYLTADDARLLLGGRLFHERTGGAARRLGLLSSFQVRTVLAYQRSRQRPLGGYFVGRGHFPPSDLARQLERLAAHNAAFAASAPGY